MNKELRISRESNLAALVVDNGGRGHAMVRELLQSDRVSQVHTSIATSVEDPGGDKVVYYQYDNKNPGDQAVNIATEQHVDFALILPEGPLAAGAVDKLHERGVPAFGPKKELAWLEGDKARAKQFMERWNIPIPPYRVCTAYQDAVQYIDSRREPLVIKAAFLAAGKGSVVCDDRRQAKHAAERLMVDGDCGGAGKEKIVVEDRLCGGIEQSVTVFISGDDLFLCPPARDYKQRHDGNVGPNTGGMGSHSPSGNEDIFSVQKVMDRILAPAMEGIRAETGISYTGILYAGLMWMYEEGKWNPIVLEFNIRPGDPEWQTIAPRLEGDWAEVFIAALNGKLGEVKPIWSPANYLTVCAVSGKVPPGLTKGKGKFPGYPGKYMQGRDIAFDKDLSGGGYFLHSGTTWKCGHDGLATPHLTPCEKGAYKTTGGRVLCAVGKGENLSTAHDQAYELLEHVCFDYMDYRKDIGDLVLLEQEREKAITIKKDA